MNNRNRIPSVLLVALLGTIALVGCKKKEEPAPMATTPPPATTPAPAPAPMPAPMPAGASVTTVDLGSAVGADMKVSAPKATFAPKDTIYVSIGTSTSDPAASVPGKLGAKWTHVDSNQTVSEDTRDVSLTGMSNTEFHIAKPDGWPTGKYKVDIMLDGNVVQTREFEVK
jgi:hypothetical protein